MHKYRLVWAFTMAGAVALGAGSAWATDQTVVFWSAGAKPLELVKSGKTSMGFADNGRAGAANLEERIVVTAHEPRCQLCPPPPPPPPRCPPACTA